MGIDQTQLKKFGLTAEEAEKAKDILPTLDLGTLQVGMAIELKILDSTPTEIEAKSKFDPNKTKALILNVYDKQARMNMSIWLSSKSLQMEFYKLGMKHKFDLKGLDIVITVRTYEHEQFGTTRAYTVQEVTKSK